jgi:hypothetical protein
MSTSTKARSNAPSTKVVCSGAVLLAKAQRNTAALESFSTILATNVLR